MSVTTPISWTVYILEVDGRNIKSILGDLVLGVIYTKNVQEKRRQRGLVVRALDL